MNGNAKDRVPSVRFDLPEPSPEPVVLRYNARQRARVRSRCAVGGGSLPAADLEGPSRPTTSLYALRLRRELQRLRRMLGYPVLGERGADFLAQELTAAADLAEAAVETLEREQARQRRRTTLEAVVESVEQRTAELEKRLQAAENLRRATVQLRSILDWFVRVGGIPWADLVEAARCVHQAASGDIIIVATDEPKLTAQVAAHAVSIARVCVAICSGRAELAEITEWAVLGGLLCDVGYLCLADSDYCVPFRLAQRDDHPLRSARVAQSLRAIPGPVVRAILEHHELGDGSGFPDGKQLPEISLLGQVLGLATRYVQEVVDAARGTTGPLPAQAYSVVRHGLEQEAAAGRYSTILVEQLPAEPISVLWLGPRPDYPGGCQRVRLAA